MLVGVSVEVGVAVSVNVGVGVCEGVSVKVGVKVRVGGCDVNVEVAVGALPCRTICGLSQMARSWLLPPLALTVRMNFNVRPARLLKSRSTG